MFGASHELAVVEVFSCVGVMNKLDPFGVIMSTWACSVALEDP